LNRAANITILTVYDSRPLLLLWLYQRSIVHNAVARRGTVIADWERRIFALNNAAGASGAWNLDTFRQTRLVCIDRRKS
jgi:hypothetical protein